MIPVTKPYLPDRSRLDGYIDGIYERCWLTNNGQLVQELTRRLEAYLGVENLLLVSNGTLALQIAYRALGVESQPEAPAPEAITTPFSFVATASSLKWEGIEPVFVDIDPQTWCMDPARIEAAITPKTRAIVPVHVFGNGCDVESIDEIGRRHGLKVIYDGAHAFGVTFKDESILRRGDATTLSFHATKLFHTAEGGAIVFKRREDLERAKKLINFGIDGLYSIGGLGINAKLNELQAAMGLAVLDEIDIIMERRGGLWRAYEEQLRGHVELQSRDDRVTNNWSYFPVRLESEQAVLEAIEALTVAGVQPRRYFYPCLVELSYVAARGGSPHAAQLAREVLCLPLFAELEPNDLRRVCDLVVAKA